tara:strand:- start:3530 stop:3850 length:321 start_codon:yes stop_codon:yes gene_type:complete
MEKIIAVTFDIADQKCKMYNALEWHNFIADAREQSEDPSASLEDLFDELYGDEFWFEVSPDPKAVYQIAFDLRSEEFVVCHSDADCEAVMEMAADAGDEEEIFWAE